MSAGGWIAAMAPLFGIFIFAIGAVLGAGADRFSYWLHVSRGMMLKKHCARCFEFQSWLTYVPVFGFVIRRGLCFSCKARLPIQSWLSEIAAGAALTFIWHAAFVGRSPEGGFEWLRLLLVALLVFGCAVLIISDLVYDEVPLALFVFTTVVILTHGFLVGTVNDIFLTLIAGLIGAGIMWILVALSHWKWVHVHDVLFGALVSMIIGWPGFFVTLSLAYLLAIFGALISWGWNKPVWRGVSWFGIYLFAALALQGILAVLTAAPV